MQDDIKKPPRGGIRLILWRFGLLWRQIVGVVLVFALLPLVFMDDDDTTKFRAAYGILLVALFWMLEVFPLAVTSLMPLVLFPFLGVVTTKDISPSYFKDTNVMFFGGLVLALAVEYCNLHRRIALKVMSIVGSSPIPLLFGVMCTAMVLSMWMSNTACCAMMLPILLAVLDQLSGSHASDEKSETESVPSTHSDDIPSGVVTVTDSDAAIFRSASSDKLLAEKKRWENIRKMYMFGVAYACNLGGTATITGTGPNLVFQSNHRDLSYDVGQGGKYMDMTFANWMALNVPAAILNTLLTFTYLVVAFYGIPWKSLPLISKCFKKEKQTKEELADAEDEERKIKSANLLIKREYEKLGPISFHECGVFLVFLTTVCLWIFREPKFMKGWNDTLDGADVGDASAAILGIVLMFLLPRNLTFFTGYPKPGQSYQALLDWKFVQSNLSWGVVLLLGGGFALSDAAEKSGLSQYVGDQLTGLESLPKPAILIIVMILTACVTEVCSNVATANVILPILFTLSQKINIHPFYLTIPATISCSFAFMLPVATPPNALVFSAGNLQILDMVKTGAFLNVACICVYFLVQISIGQLLFNYSGYEYATNSTVNSLGGVLS